LCVYAVGMSVLAVLAFENGYSKLFKFASGFSQSRKLPRLQSTLEFCHPSHGCRQTVGHFQIAESCVIWQVAKSIMRNLGKQRVYALMVTDCKFYYFAERDRSYFSDLAARRCIETSVPNVHTLFPAP
jgi:hypothetical protein